MQTSLIPPLGVQRFTDECKIDQIILDSPNPIQKGIKSFSELQKIKNHLKEKSILDEDDWLTPSTTQQMQLLPPPSLSFKNIPTIYQTLYLRLWDRIDNLTNDDTLLLIGTEARNLSEEYFAYWWKAILEFANLEMMRADGKDFSRTKDTDFKVILKNRSFDELNEIDKTFIHLASQLDLELVKTVPLFIPNNHSYVTTTLHDTCQGKMDNIFVAQEGRNHLFAKDALAVQLKKGKNEECKVLLLLDKNPFQVVIDNFLKFIHVDDPVNVDKMGWPRAMRFLSQGYTLSKSEDVEILLNTSSKSYESLGRLMLRCHELHDGGEVKSLLFTYLNSCFELKEQGKDFENLWKELEGTCRQAKDPLSQVILSSLEELTPEILLSLLELASACKMATNAWDGSIKIFAIEHKKKFFLQLDDHYTLLIPFQVTDLYTRFSRMQEIPLQQLSSLLDCLLRETKVDTHHANQLYLNQELLNLDEAGFSKTITENYHKQRMIEQKVFHYYFALILQASFPSSNKFQFLLEEFISVQANIPLSMKKNIVDFLLSQEGDKELLKAVSFLIDADRLDLLQTLWNWRIKCLVNICPLSLWNLQKTMIFLFPKDALTTFLKLHSQHLLNAKEQWESLNLFLEKMSWRELFNFVKDLSQLEFNLTDNLPTFINLIKLAKQKQEWNDLLVLLDQFLQKQYLKINKEVATLFEQIRISCLQESIEIKLELWKIGNQYQLIHMDKSKTALFQWLLDIYVAIFNKKGEKEQTFINYFEQYLIQEKFTNLVKLIEDLILKDFTKAAIFYKILGESKISGHERERLFWYMMDQFIKKKEDHPFYKKIMISIVLQFLPFTKQKIDKKKEHLILQLVGLIIDQMSLKELKRKFEIISKITLENRLLSQQAGGLIQLKMLEFLCGQSFFSEAGNLWQVHPNRSLWRATNLQMDYQKILISIYKNSQDFPLKSEVLAELQNLKIMAPGLSPAMMIEITQSKIETFIQKLQIDEARKLLDRNFKSLPKFKATSFYQRIFQEYLKNQKMDQIFAFLEFLKSHTDFFDSLDLVNIIHELANHPVLIQSRWRDFLKVFDMNAWRGKFTQEHYVETLILMSSSLDLRILNSMIEIMRLILQVFKTANLTINRHSMRNFFQNLSYLYEQPLFINLLQSGLDNFENLLEKATPSILQTYFRTQDYAGLCKWMEFLNRQHILIEFSDELKTNFSAYFTTVFKQDILLGKYMNRMSQIFTILRKSNHAEGLINKIAFNKDMMDLFKNYGEINLAFQRAQDFLYFQGYSKNEKQLDCVNEILDFCLSVFERQTIRTRVDFLREVVNPINMSCKKFKFHASIISILDELINKLEPHLLTHIVHLVKSYQVVEERQFLAILPRLKKWGNDNSDAYNLYLLTMDKTNFSPEGHFKVLSYLIIGCDIMAINWMIETVRERLISLEKQDLQARFLRSLIGIIAKLSWHRTKNLNYLKEQIDQKLFGNVWQIVQDQYEYSYYECILEDENSPETYLAGLHKLCEAKQVSTCIDGELMFRYLLKGIKLTFNKGGISKGYLIHLSSQLIHQNNVDLHKTFKLLETLNLYSFPAGCFLGLRWFNLLEIVPANLALEQYQTLKNFLIKANFEPSSFKELQLFYKKIQSLVKKEDECWLRHIFLYHSIKLWILGFDHEPEIIDLLKQDLFSTLGVDIDKGMEFFLIFFQSTLASHMWIDVKVMCWIFETLNLVITDRCLIYKNWKWQLFDWVLNLENKNLLLESLTTFKGLNDLDKEEIELEIFYQEFFSVAVSSEFIKNALEKVMTNGHAATINSWSTHRFSRFFKMLLRTDRHLVLEFHLKPFFLLFSCLNQRWMDFGNCLIASLSNLEQSHSNLKAIHDYKLTLASEKDIQKKATLPKEKKILFQSFGLPQINLESDFSFLLDLNQSFFRKLILEWIESSIKNIKDFAPYEYEKILSLYHYFLKILIPSSDSEELILMITLMESIFKMPIAEEFPFFSETIRASFDSIYIQVHKQFLAIIASDVRREKKEIELLNKFCILQFLFQRPLEMFYKEPSFNFKQIAENTLELALEVRGNSSLAILVFDQILEEIPKMKMDPEDLFEYKLAMKFFLKMKKDLNFSMEFIFYNKSLVSMIKVLGDLIANVKNFKSKKRIAKEYSEWIQKIYSSNPLEETLNFYLDVIGSFIKQDVLEEADMDKSANFLLLVASDKKTLLHFVKYQFRIENLMKQLKRKKITLSKVKD